MTITRNQQVFLLFCSGIILVTALVTVFIFRAKISQGQDKNQNQPILFQRKYADSSTVTFNRVLEFNNSIYRVWSFPNTLYVHNWDECNIMKIDTLGNILTRFGRKGRGPGEFLTITDVSIHQEYLTVIDHRNLTISVFEDNGKIIKSDKLEFGITGGTKISQNRYLFKSYNTDKQDKEFLFTFNSNDKKIENFYIPRLLKSKAAIEASNIELAGFYIKRSQGHVFRVYSFAGQFAAFDTTGKLLYQAYTIDKSPLPKVTIRGSGKDLMIMPASRDINLDADVDDKYLYILSNAATPDIKMIAAGTNAQGVIDIYNVNDGTYLCSMKIPIIFNPKDKLLQKSSPLTISICNSTLYVVQGVGIYCFSIDRTKIIAASH